VWFCLGRIKILVNFKNSPFCPAVPLLGAFPRSRARPFGRPRFRDEVPAVVVVVLRVNLEEVKSSRKHASEVMIFTKQPLPSLSLVALSRFLGLSLSL
jgi:hypothetical protein